MEDFEELEELEENQASGIYTNIEEYLNDRFNYPGTDDGIKQVQSATGFEGWMNDRFGNSGL